MKRKLRVAVVGYGSGGQATALMLARDGHRVEVFERVAQPGPVGAGFLLQPVGLQVLWELGLLQDVLTHGAPITRLYGQTARGRAVMDMRYGELDRRLFGLGLQRGALFQLLDAAWNSDRCLHLGRSIESLDPEQGSLTDDQGKTHRGFDLIVVADGAASALRGKVVSARLDRPYPWGAQWCLVEQGNWPWPDELQQRYVSARRMAGMLPVGTRPDDPTPRLSFFWSLPAQWFEDGQGASDWRPELTSLWPESSERLRTIAVPDGLARARYRDTVHKAWFRGRALLLGDAAHAMSPQLGQGVNMALLDAMALRDALRRSASVAEALAACQKERRSHVRIYHFWSRWLTPMFQSDRRFGPALRDALFHPLSRWPGARGQMLRVLTGTRRGWFGCMHLPAAFLDALAMVECKASPGAYTSRVDSEDSGTPSLEESGS